MDTNLPLSLKRQVFNQCIIPTTAYGCGTWAINKHQMTKIRLMQRTMEIKILQIKLKDKIPHRDIRKWQPREGRRNRGRPARRWRDDIEVAAGKTWMKKTKDREEWRRLSEGYVLQWTDNAYK